MKKLLFLPVFLFALSGCEHGAADSCCSCACSSETVETASATPVIVKVLPAAERDALVNARTVVSGKIKKIHQGIMALSYPPILHVKLDIEGLKILSGQLDTPQKIPFIWHGETLPFAEGDFVILTGDAESFTQSFKADAEKCRAASALLNMTAPGWTLADDGTLKGPWSNMDNRPVPPFSSERLVLTSKQVLPTEVKEFENPYGDGEFELTLMNTGKEPVTCEALRQRDGKILWDECVVARSGDKTFVFDVPMPPSTTPVVLKPGESVRGKVNTLLLQDLNWPNGGSRVHFLFSIGQTKDNNFFYYYSKRHDSMRKTSNR